MGRSFKQVKESLIDLTQVEVSVKFVCSLICSFGLNTKVTLFKTNMKEVVYTLIITNLSIFISRLVLERCVHKR